MGHRKFPNFYSSMECKKFPQNSIAIRKFVKTLQNSIDIRKCDKTLQNSMAFYRIYIEQKWNIGIFYRSLWTFPIADFKKVELDRDFIKRSFQKFYRNLQIFLKNGVNSISQPVPKILETYLTFPISNLSPESFYTPFPCPLQQ